MKNSSPEEKAETSDEERSLREYCRSLDVWLAGRREILWLAVKMSISFAKEGN